MKNVRLGALALAALVTAIAIAGCGSSKSHGEEGTLKLVEPGGESGKSFGAIGNPTRKGVGPGSGFAFSSPLQNSTKETVGELNAFCIATAPSPGESLHGTCSGTAAVPGGSFALNVGGKSIGNDITGAIVGGTGKYNGALGTFASKATGKGENAPEDLTFDYILP
jgi:hypothetical protein